MTTNRVQAETTTCDWVMSNRLRCALQGLTPTVEEVLEDEAYERTIRKCFTVRVGRMKDGTHLYSVRWMTQEQYDKLLENYRRQDDYEILTLLHDCYRRLRKICFWNNELLSKILPPPPLDKPLGDKKTHV